MDTLQQVAEIQVTYRTKVKAKDRPRISSSADAHRLLFDLWNKDTIEYSETFYLLLINRASAVLGYKVVSTGGLAGTVVDVKQILAIALKANAASILMAHNHPSCSLQPSQEDCTLTRRVKEACQLLDLSLLDHLILSPEGYFSFADDGRIGSGHANNRKRQATTGFQELAIGRRK